MVTWIKADIRRYVEAYEFSCDYGIVVMMENIVLVGGYI